MSVKEGPGFTHWITKKTSNDELYMFKIQCMKQELGKALLKKGGIEYLKWRHVRLDEATSNALNKET